MQSRTPVNSSTILLVDSFTVFMKSSSHTGPFEMITLVLFQKMPEVSSDKPQAVNPIFPSKLRKPQADSHPCRACLLNCVLFIFCAFHQNCHTEGYKNNFQRFLGRGAVFTFFFLPFRCSMTEVSTKGRQTAQYQL